MNQTIKIASAQVIANPIDLVGRAVKQKAMIGDVAAILLLSYISIVNLNHFDTSWDTLTYHLPFAGLRAGIISPGQFTLPSVFHFRYFGFPPLVDYAQGVLWRLFGRPEAAELTSTIAILALSVYLRTAFRVGMIWTVMIFLAVPILHTAIGSAYVDLWTNAFFVIHLFAGVKARSPCRNRLAHTAISCAALAVAVNSKEQYFVIGALSFVLFWLDRIVRLAVGRPARPLAAPELRDLALFAVLAPAIFFSPIRNLVVYGNPVYPVSVKVAGHAFPGTESNEWGNPAAIAHFPQPVRFVLSQLDLEATNMRPDGYVLDQGSQPTPGLPGERMGGSLAVLLLMALAYLVIALRRPLAGTPDRLVIGGFVVLVGAVSLLPFSNELRYSTFAEITIIVSALYLLTRVAFKGDETAAALAMSLKIGLACSAIYVASLTGWYSLKLPHHQSAGALVKDSGISDQVRALASKHTVICYPRDDKSAFMYSPALNAKIIGKSYGFVWTHNAAECPAGSGVIS